MAAVSLIIPNMTHSVVLCEICAHMLCWAAPFPLLRDDAADVERPCFVDGVVYLCKSWGAYAMDTLQATTHNQFIRENLRFNGYTQKMGSNQLYSTPCVAHVVFFISFCGGL